MTVIFIGIGIIGVIKGVSTNSVRQNSWDGSVRQVEGYLRNNLKDPKSLEIIEWSRLESTGSGFVVRCKYRAKNSFGAFTVEDKVFRLDGSGTIVSVADYYP